MPCRDYSDAEERAQYRERIDFLARNLCWVLGTLEVKNYKLHLPSELAEWWTEHKKRDLERKQKESWAAVDKAKKQQAIKKLTKEEQKLLGIK